MVTSSVNGALCWGGFGRIGVVGAGTMGQGIAQIAAQGGLQVRVWDQNPESADRALRAIDQILVQQMAKGKIDATTRDAINGRVSKAGTMADLRDCDLVVEAVVEDLSVKQGLFKQLEAIVSSEAVLATNTSSLSVTAVAAQCVAPGRVLGWHFFNPVPLMKIAEVVRGEQTDEAVAQRVHALTQALGHCAVRALDSPGFVVNHAGRAFIPEGLRLLSEGIAGVATIDHIMRDCAGFRMGPLELLDLVGLDVGQMVMTSLYHQYQEEPRFRITPLVSRKVAAGQLGRKSGQGFYHYTNGQVVQEKPVNEFIDPLPLPPVWVAPFEPDLAHKVRTFLAAVPHIHLETASKPSPGAIAILTPVGDDTSTLCVKHTLDPKRTVGVDALFSFDKRCALMAAPGFDQSLRATVAHLFTANGTAVSWLRDSPGFVAQRIVAQIVNIGADMAQHRVAIPADIDAAVVLALGYPVGPFGWGERIGAQRILQISEALYAAYGDPRYRPSIWLRRRAKLQQPLDQMD